MIPRDLIVEARKNLAEKQWEKAEPLYKEAIDILQERLSDSDDTKMALWSTQAESLQSKPWIYKNETREEFRNRILDSIKYIYKCSKLNDEYDKQFTPSLKQTIKQLILTIGCIVPEIETHVIITCPISLRQTEFGKMGTSIAGYYEKAICTICRLEILDENCPHEIGERYNGKICQMEPISCKYPSNSVTDIHAITTTTVATPKYWRLNSYKKHWIQG